MTNDKRPNDLGLPAEVHKLAKDFLLAKSAFNREYCRRWHTVQRCSEETGWTLLDVLRGEVQLFVFDRKRGNGGIAQAAWEIFRKALTGEAAYTFTDAARFVKWYEATTKKIGRAIGHFYEFHGDCFGDLIDSYPLAGKELAERALASAPDSRRPRREGFLDEREVTDAVEEKYGLAWRKLICGGENYVVAKLENSCQKAYLSCILKGEDECVTWTPDEYNAVTFVDQYDD